MANGNEIFVLFVVTIENKMLSFLTYQFFHSDSLEVLFYKSFHIYNLNNEKNTYRVGCNVSVIFLYASKDADSNVCIIKKQKTKTKLQIYTSVYSCTELDTGVSAQLQHMQKSNLAIRFPCSLNNKKELLWPYRLQQFSQFTSIIFLNQKERTLKQHGFYTQDVVFSEPREMNSALPGIEK